MGVPLNNADITAAGGDVTARADIVALQGRTTTLETTTTSLQNQININLALASVYSTLAAALAAVADGTFVNVLQSNGMSVDLYQRVSGALVYMATSPVGIGFAQSQRIVLENAALSVTPWPVPPSIYLNPIDAIFNENALIPNRMAVVAATRDYYQFESAMTAGSGGVLTRNFAADPWGGNTANRSQLTPGGGAANNVLFPVSGSAPSEAGTWRLRFMAKSNAGAGAQTARIQKNGAVGGSVFNTTEGAWLLVDVILTALVNGDIVNMLSNGATADILFTKPVVTQMQVAGTTQYVPCTGGFSHKTLSVPGSLVLNNAAFIGPYDGTIKYAPDGRSTVNFVAMTMIFIVRKDSASAAGFKWALLSGSEIAFGDNSGVAWWIMPGLSNSVGLALDNMGFAVIGLKWDGTRAEAWLNGVKVKATASANAAINEAITYYGGVQGGTYTGTHGPFAQWNMFLSDLQMAQATKSIVQRFTLYGSQIGNTNFIIIEGDSISAQPPSGATTSHAVLAAQALNCFYLDFAVAGSTIANMLARQPAMIAAVQQAKASGMNPTVTFMIGVNSIGVAPSTFQPYIDAAVAAGASVVVSTVTSTGINTATQTNAYNALVRALTNCTICDIGANALLGGNTAYTNTTYFNAYPTDAVPHPNQVGQNLMQTILQPVLAALQR